MTLAKCCSALITDGLKLKHYIIMFSQGSLKQKEKESDQINPVASCSSEFVLSKRSEIQPSLFRKTTPPKKSLGIHTLQIYLIAIHLEIYKKKVNNGGSCKQKS